MAQGILLFASLWLWSIGSIQAQHSPYSLQAAVDALHRREAQLALRNYNNPAHLAGLDDDYWNEEPEGPPLVNRQQLNRLLAKYLSREEESERGDGFPEENNFDDDNYALEERKRSFFRERDEKYDGPNPSVFRERELEGYVQPKMTEEFLREIENERDEEREERYKEFLKLLWEKYLEEQQEIENELEEDKKKRQLLPYLTPMQRKRGYPVLPWLPASRNKRFPVAKRSAKRQDDKILSAGTDEKVAKDLQAIFGQPRDDKKKRSSGDEPMSGTTHSSDDKDNKSSSHSHSSTQHHHGGDEHDEEDSEESEHYSAADDDDYHDFDDEGDEDRKKKRDIAAKKKRTNQEIIKEDEIIPGDLNNFRKKKSFQWSKYFGMDRRKKSNQWFLNNEEDLKKKRQPLDLEEEKKRKKKNEDDDRLESMDNKLKAIEDLIIDQTVKFTGAHEGITDPEDIRELKDHVVSRLATAYSLEKMRRALDKLRQSVDRQNHLELNEIEPDDEEKKKRAEDEEKKKRLTIKKEKVVYNHEHNSSESPSTEKVRDVGSNGVEDSENDKKKKKKREGEQEYSEASNDLNDFEDELGAGHFEPMSEIYSNGRSDSSRGQCPLLEKMEQRCRGVDLLSGDIHQELLPICGIHQLCYLCGTSQTACDLQYLSEADSICGRNSECESTARAALMMLRGAPGPQLGPKECLKNPCLYRAMRDIGL